MTTLATTARPTALLVDDSKMIRMLLGHIMHAFGFETFEAEDGRAALEVLEAEGVVDVVLLDWNMPRMDGYELLRVLRGDARYSALKIMMVTTESEMAQIARALDAGADEYIMKPFNDEIIHSKLELLGLSPGPVSGEA